MLFKLGEGLRGLTSILDAAFGTLKEGDRVTITQDCLYQPDALGGTPIIAVNQKGETINARPLLIPTAIFKVTEKAAHPELGRGTWFALETETGSGTMLVAFQRRDLRKVTTFRPEQPKRPGRQTRNTRRLPSGK